MKPFQYKPCIPVSEWGCHFDSLLELKYALSLGEDYDFLRARIPIYYDPKTKRSTDYLRYNTKRYTPDFLIRNKYTLQAYWVEIKPRAFDNEKELALRRIVAEDYIRRKGFDWTYTVVYDDEIHLRPREQEIYNSYYRYKRKYLGKPATFTSGNKPPSFNLAVDNRKIHFIMFGYPLPSRRPVSDASLPSHPSPHTVLH